LNYCLGIHFVSPPLELSIEQTVCSTDEIIQSQSPENTKSSQHLYSPANRCRLGLYKNFKNNFKKLQKLTAQPRTPATTALRPVIPD
jgi:hypothetical protein